MAVGGTEFQIYSDGEGLSFAVNDLEARSPEFMGGISTIIDVLRNNGIVDDLTSPDSQAFPHIARLASSVVRGIPFGFLVHELVSSSNVEPTVKKMVADELIDKMVDIGYGDLGIGLYLDMHEDEDVTPRSLNWIRLNLVEVIRKGQYPIAKDMISYVLETYNLGDDTEVWQGMYHESIYELINEAIGYAQLVLSESEFNRNKRWGYLKPTKEDLLIIIGDFLDETILSNQGEWANQDVLGNLEVDAVKA